MKTKRREIADGQRTGELRLDGTEINAVHELNELYLVEFEDFVTNGEEWHLACISEFCAMISSSSTLSTRKSKTTERRTHLCDHAN